MARAPSTRASTTAWPPTRSHALAPRPAREDRRCARSGSSEVDLRAQKAVHLAGDAPLARLAASIGQVTGMGPVQVFVSPRLGSGCIAVGSSPPTIAIGEALAGSDRPSTFLVVRALKLVHARASVLARVTPAELNVFIPAWLRCFNPTWQPQGVNPAQLNAVGERIQAALPRNLDSDMAIIALEAAGTIGTRADVLGASAIAWANRVALLALGDPNAAIDAIAIAGGDVNGAPRDPKERAAWIARTPEACDLIAFAVTDAFAETRARLGLDA